MKMINSFDDGMDLYKLFSTEAKMRIANLLFHVDEMCVTDVDNFIEEIDQSGISTYLKGLKRMGIAIYRREAQKRYYRFTNEGKRFIYPFLLPLQSIPEIQDDNRRIHLMNL
jgi:DNA-binding transcriptional ArsR family regulator